MLPNLNPKKMQAMMKQLGMSQEEIDAKRVIIEKEDNSKIIIKNPSIMKMNIQGQESFQITGEISQKEGELFSKEDIKTVMEKTNCNEDKAKKALENANGDLAEAILKISD